MGLFIFYIKAHIRTHPLPIETLSILTNNSTSGYALKLNLNRRATYKQINIDLFLKALFDPVLLDERGILQNLTTEMSVWHNFTAPHFQFNKNV